jgi:hypothetical protein
MCTHRAVARTRFPPSPHHHTSPHLEFRCGIHCSLSYSLARLHRCMPQWLYQDAEYGASYNLCTGHLVHFSIDTIASSGWLPSQRQCILHHLPRCKFSQTPTSVESEAGGVHILVNAQAAEFLMRRMAAEPAHCRVLCDDDNDLSESHLLLIFLS